MKRQKSKPPVGAPAPHRAFKWSSALLILGAVALALRLANLYELRNAPLFSVLIGDSLMFDMLAQGIVAGDWMGTKVFYQPPLYPYVMALAYAIFGHDVFTVRLVQAFLGAVSCVFLAIAGKRFFDAPSGLAAGSLLAIYAPAIFFDGLIHKSSVDVFIVSVLLVALGACLDRPKWRWLVVAGVSIGALAWNRENARVLFPAVAGWLLLSHRDVSLKQRLSWVAVLTLGAAVILGPVAVRNIRSSGEILVTSSQFGPNFYIGNHLGSSGGYEPLVPGRGNVLFERDDATRIAEAAAGRRLSAGEVSDYWWHRTLTDIRQAPGAWVRLLAKKTWMTFAAGELVDTESLEAYAGSSRVLRALRPFTFGIVMALAVFGAWMTRGMWRRLAVLYVIFAIMALSVVIFFVFARYRFPLVPIAMVFAAAGVVLLGRVRGMSRREWLPAAATALVLAVLLHIPVKTSADETYANYGSELLRQERPAEAVPLLREAVRRDPSHVRPRLDLALALQKTGQVQGAMDEFQMVARLDSGSAEAQAGLAIGLHQQGRPGEAIRFYREAIRLKPTSAELMSNLALALLAVGDDGEAIAVLRRAAALQPHNVGLRLNLCRSLADTRRAAEALTCHQQAAAAARRPQEVLEAEYALGQAYAAAGRLTEASASFERALVAARSLVDANAISAIETALQMLRRARSPQ